MLDLKCSTDSEYVSVFFFPGIFYIALAKYVTKMFVFGVIPVLIFPHLD